MNEFRALVALVVVLFVVLSAVVLEVDEHQMHSDGDCIVSVHEQRSIFDSDHTEITTYCETEAP